MKAIIAPIVLLALLLGGCGAGEGPFESVSLPAEDPSGQPRLHAGPHGLLASWVETADGTAALRFAEWEARGWSAPRTAATGDDWFVNWADTPGVVRLDDGSYLAFYLQRTGAQPYAYGIRVVRSADGERWSEPIVPYDGELPVEYGFVSVVPQGGGDAMLVWLDGREMYGGEGASAEGHGAHGPMALRSASLTPDGGITDASLLDNRTCECCPTAAVAAGEGVVVAYRDRTEDEIRDIAVVHLGNEASAGPEVPHPDGWRIAGCPVNGPALSAAGEHVALAWFTGAGGGSVRVSFSGDGGRTFGGAHRIDGGRPVGRVSTAMTDSGEALVVWLEASDDGAELLVRRVEPEGSTGEPVVAATATADRATGMPRMAVHGGYAWVMWVETGSPNRVRMARARVDDLR